MPEAGLGKEWLTPCFFNLFYYLVIENGGVQPASLACCKECTLVLMQNLN